jgi:predicted P-loop ATPase
MSEKIYDLTKGAYLDAGYWVRRVSPGKKGCRDQNWQRQQPEVEQTAAYDGIAIMAGSPMPDGTTFGFVDVDHDGLTAAFRMMFGPTCERLGSKGTAIPVRIDGNVLNGKFYMQGVSKPAVELMAHQSIVVIPPTIHPDTKKPYQWLGRNLLDMPFEDLPLVDSRRVELIKALIENEHISIILDGQGTHAAGLALVGRLVHHSEDDELLEKMIRSLFPEDYEGDSLKELKGWITSARKKVETGKWEKKEVGFQRTKNGAITVCERNTRLALERMEVTSRYDMFADRELVRIGTEPERPNSDNIECSLRSRMDMDFNYRVPPNVFRDTMRAIALEKSFHPVKNYLNGLQWDGTNRADEWLIKHGGADDTAYVRAVSKLILVGAVRRIMKPGVKFDEMLVIKSFRQGTGKSTALNVLAVRDEWFCDNFSLDQDSKTLIELTMGKWIIEISELKGLSRGGSDHVKSLLSRQHDRSRLAYGRIVEERARQFVFIGTTNEKEFLRDETGNRRFWPVEVQQIDLKGLRADRDQLWAEAVEIERTGVSLMLPDDLKDAAEAMQEAHRVMDNPYIDVLREKLGEYDDVRILSTDLMEMLDIEPGKVNNAQYKTLRSAMLELGWNYRRSIRVGKNVSGGYVKGDGAEVIQMPSRTPDGSKKPLEY